MDKVNYRANVLWSYKREDEIKKGHTNKIEDKRRLQFHEIFIKILYVFCYVSCRPTDGRKGKVNYIEASHLKMTCIFA